MSEPLERRLETWHDQHEELIMNPHSSQEDYQRILAEGARLLKETNDQRKSILHSYQSAVQFM